MGDEKLQELLHAVIGELAVGIAPLTVVLVEAAVQIPADDLITVQGHTTALTDQLARVTQQMIDGGIKTVRTTALMFPGWGRTRRFPSGRQPVV